MAIRSPSGAVTITSAAGQAIAGSRILVADDNIAIRHVICRHLAAADAIVLEADNGESALQIAQREDLDLILLDVEMPGLDGLAVCRALRASQHTSMVPIAFLTGRHDDASHAEALLAGGDDFIGKPFTTAVLLARIANMVRRQRAEKEARRLHDELARYVSKPVRARRQSGAVERVCAAVLFSDLRGFTATSAIEDPVWVFRAISDVLARQTEIVHAAGGYVDKFSGDGMLAVFEGHSGMLHACQAAKDIVAWARQFEGISFWQPPPIGIGIHSGEFLRGDLGGAEQRDWTVLGTTVNVAARLCGLAGALEIAISDVVRADVAGRIAVGEPRYAKLKGLEGDFGYCLVL